MKSDWTKKDELLKWFIDNQTGKKKKISLKSKKLLLRKLEDGGYIKKYFKTLDKIDFYEFLRKEGDNYKIQQNLRQIIRDEERARMLKLEKAILILNGISTLTIAIFTIVLALK